jgi:hypothetical protein
MFGQLVALRLCLFKNTVVKSILAKLGKWSKGWAGAFWVSKQTLQTSKTPKTL